jgi:hypothetical protein
MSDWQKIAEFARKKVAALSKEHATRLEFEIKEIDKQGANDYWINLLKSKQKFEANTNGLVLPFLLGITPVDPVDCEYVFKIDETGEEDDIMRLVLDNGKTISVPSRALIKTINGPIIAKDLKVEDELT